MTSEVAIIGAGPYGLAAAAHLRRAGVETRVFGETMSFWDEQMPKGMLLRSPEGASTIGDPEGAFAIDRYFAESGEAVPHPVPLDRFVDYGRWFASRVAPDIDGSLVKSIYPKGDKFLLVTSDDREHSARRVVVAAGIAAFPRVPPWSSSLPRELASHTAAHRDLSIFAGKRVVVIGAGQSALESAALLSEAGAAVEVIARRRRIVWLRGGSGSLLHAALHSRMNPFEKLMFPTSDIGPPGINYLVDKPDLFKAVPSEPLRLWLERVAIRPAGSGWLPARLRAVKISAGVSVVRAEPTSGRLAITTSDGRKQEADHLLLGTGYAIDIARYPFLSRELVAQIRTSDGYPILNDGFECSMPGLHFIGAPAARSFSPLMRFVAGSGFAASRLARAIAAGRSPRYAEASLVKSAA